MDEPTEIRTFDDDPDGQRWGLFEGVWCPMDITTNWAPPSAEDQPHG